MARSGDHQTTTTGVIDEPVEADAIHTVTLAMADPLDFETRNTVTSCTGLAVRPSLANEQEILDAIEKRLQADMVSAPDSLLVAPDVPQPSQFETM